MTMAENQEQALNAYLNLLKSQGAGLAVIQVRKHFLRYLIAELQQQEMDASYRDAIDVTLARFPENNERAEMIAAAREFFPFWQGDIKGMARVASGGLTIKRPQLRIEGTLMEMMEKMDRDPWSQTDPAPLLAYISALIEKGSDSAVIDIRERMIKLLLYIMRDAGTETVAYRAGVDGLLSLLSKEQARVAFLEVARAFFPFWIEHRQQLIAQRRAVA